MESGWARVGLGAGRQCCEVMILILVTNWSPGCEAFVHDARARLVQGASLSTGRGRAGRGPETLLRDGCFDRRRPSLASPGNGT